jgi:uncharacterized protein (TIGR02646 family)
MKWIDKKLKNQPASLKQHLKTPHHNYENYDKKDELRLALLKEQGFICCYCMRRIQDAMEEKMKIEHFKAFSIYNGINGKRDLTLNYSNLLGVCKGNKGAPKHLQHCDESKGNTEILINPTDKTMMQKIRFNSEGRIFISGDTDLDKTLNNDLDAVTALNLNIQTLREERKRIWTTLDQQMRKEFGNKPFTKSFINQKLKDVSTWTNGKYEPMCQVYIYYFEKKLRQAI